jgi:predicted lipid carrier protein YhbT
MANTSVSIPVLRRVLAGLPPHLLAAALRALLRQIGDRHPRLLRNLAALPASCVTFTVTDLPHGFVLHYGEAAPTTLGLIDPAMPETPHANVKGDLASLLALLEGESDGDTLFFDRTITVTGDSARIVGLRNTLDREALNLTDEVLSSLGRFAEPAGLALALGQRVAHGLRRHLAAFHAALHAEMKEDTP